MMANITKVSWITNAKRLQLESDLIEKNLKIPLNADELKSESTLLLKNRIDSKHSFNKRMFNFRTILNDIQSKLHQGSLLVNNKLLNEQLESFENKLTSFKVLMRNDFDLLEDSIYILDTDLHKVQQLIDTWDDRDTADIEPNSIIDKEASKRFSIMQKQNLERKAFIGGLDRKNDWDSRDHDAMLRIWNQFYSQLQQHHKEAFEHKLMEDFRIVESKKYLHDLSILELPYAPKKSLLMKKLSSTLPWKSTEEIEDCMIWYVNYLTLVLVKKKAVSDWKKEVSLTRRKRNEDTLVAEILTPSEDIFDELTSNNNSKKDNVTSAEDREAARKRIMKWKADRAENKKKEEIEKLEEEELTKKYNEEQRKRKQTVLKTQVSKWKNDEKLSKDLVAESNARLIRPKSVDPAVLSERQARDLESARVRCEKVDLKTKQSSEREKKIRETVILIPCNEAERNPKRLLSNTKASKSNSLTYEDLDEADRRRRMVGAHDSNVALTGRDLVFSGRAVPIWIKNAR